MTSVQDKLAASVRRAKAAGTAPAPTPDAAPARARKRPPPAPPAPRVHAGGIPDSSTALHPARVWPD